MDFPFELKDGRMWVEANLKGEKLTGILDTGADGTGINHELSERLGLVRRKTQTTTITPGAVEVRKTDPVDFGLGGISLTADEANVMPLSKHLKGLNFILGFDALRKTPFTIDYSKGVLRFGFLPEGVSSGFVLPGDIRPSAELKVAGVGIPAVLDSGSGTGISFPAAWVREHLSALHLQRPQKRAILGMEYESQRFALEEIVLGGVRLAEVEAQTVEAEEGSVEEQGPVRAGVGNPVVKMFRQVE